MEGPFPTLEGFCESADIADNRCVVAHPECGTPSGAGNLPRAPFLEARVLGTCDVALRAPGGWYIVSTAGLPWWSAFVHNGDRYMSEITSIAPSMDRKSVLVRGTFVHGTSAAKMPWLDAPPTGDAWTAWYECEERLFVCQIGDHAPSCAGPFPIAFTRSAVSLSATRTTFGSCRRLLARASRCDRRPVSSRVVRRFPAGRSSL